MLCMRKPIKKGCCLYWHFLGNVCTCSNGVAETGVGCPVKGEAKCESCNAGWAINSAKTECIRTCEYCRIHESRQKLSAPVIHLEFHVVANACPCVRSLFAANTCTCKNGVAQTGADCSVNGAANCAFCMTGWTINHNKTECIRT